jgi:hypothetical protein
LKNIRRLFCALRKKRRENRGRKGNFLKPPPSWQFQVTAESLNALMGTENMTACYLVFLSPTNSFANVYSLSKGNCN